MCGLGGFHPIHLVHFIDAILADRPSDIVVLDLNTPAWRKEHYTAADYYWQIRYPIEAVKRTGAIVLFVNFPRADVNYEDDIASTIIASICAETNCAYLDIASELYRDNAIKGILKDEVHVTPAGTQLYADRVEAAIRALPAEQTRVIDILPSGRFGYVPISKVIQGETEIFERTGFADKTVVIGEGNKKIGELPDSCFIDGFLVVTGPRAGWINVDNNKGESRRFITYDKNSYYRRFIPQLLTPFFAESISIYSDNELPDIKLLKGVADVGSRENVVAGLLISDSPAPLIIKEMKIKANYALS